MGGAFAWLFSEFGIYVTYNADTYYQVRRDVDGRCYRSDEIRTSDTRNGLFSPHRIAPYHLYRRMKYKIRISFITIRKITWADNIKLNIIYYDYGALYIAVLVNK